ncbi:sugar-binding transcriptional regulator [Lacticaseibacillus sharpeae]|uniref:Central glycolyticproteinregulator n=1 Tax=Lacticaseibacillus sharpeae JCM 1186 = DSM 20505 TaxID=1291052 RepID=A0A0R1ZN55_9LACO|nr:sugar-binding domain-containing protein [Lacticaseibacillus sharpeae]KRM56471.1 central glycolyticproteinregulator [Lacticaseibacillus sharpeae JCM 1186 = DSM 20505]
MQSDFAWIEAIAPDMLAVATKRYQILQYVGWMEPVGRRALADQMHTTERMLRTEVDFMRRQGLLESSRSGMVLTAKGRDVFASMDDFMNQVLGIRSDEKALAKRLGIEHCLIVSGDADQSSRVLDDMGKNLARMMQLLLPTGRQTIAVMGGTTLARAARQFSFQLSTGRDLVFVPARGGVGETVDIQANSVAAAMAQSTGGTYKVLYIPENVSEETYQPLLKEPSVKEVLELIDNSSVVIHSVGEALVMARRRNMPTDIQKMLREHHAVAETFGTFFDADGQVVYKIPKIGLRIRDLDNIPFVFAIAGGRSKAKAIEAYMQHAPKQTWLITDAGAANSILTGGTR